MPTKNTAWATRFPSTRPLSSTVPSYTTWDRAKRGIPTLFRLTVPAARPGVLQVVEVIEIGGIAADHATLGHFDVAVLVEERLDVEIMFFHISSECCFYIAFSCFKHVHCAFCAPPAVLGTDRRALCSAFAFPCGIPTQEEQVMRNRTRTPPLRGTWSGCNRPS